MYIINMSIDSVRMYVHMHSNYRIQTSCYTVDKTLQSVVKNKIQSYFGPLSLTRPLRMRRCLVGYGRVTHCCPAQPGTMIQRDAAVLSYCLQPLRIAQGLQLHGRLAELVWRGGLSIEYVESIQALVYVIFSFCFYLLILWHPMSRLN
jgi:hypothetical protein